MAAQCEEKLTAQNWLFCGNRGYCEDRTIEGKSVAHRIRVAVIEDDLPTSHQFKAWIESAKSGILVDQWFNRDDAEAAIAREHYDLVVLDIELGRERHAGVAIINAINKNMNREGTASGLPVLVVSAMPATIYRSIMKALDAWDYLQKATFEEADFIETLLDMLRVVKERRQQQGNTKELAPKADALSMDPLRQRTPMWRGQRINLPLTAQRILAVMFEKRGQIVSYDDLYEVVKSGRNRDNIRKHVSTIRDAFREIDPAFEGIENVPMRGFRWVESA
ncbi:MAG: response regulator transcription factor [Burkholderiales bacterium]|nr:response regulator transcription factor [Burkholderiales bacterium]